MMRRAAAWIMALLMMFQVLPVGAESASAQWYQMVSDEVDISVFHAVRFVAEGNEVTTAYVEDGNPIDQVPDAPAVSGKKFLGWYRNNVLLNKNAAITEDLEYTAVYTEVDPDLEELKKDADFLFEDEGTYANIAIFGTHKKNQVPAADKANLAGDSVLEAWTANNIKNKTKLTLEAVITGVPEEGSLVAWKVRGGSLFELAGEDLMPGDRVVFDLSMKGTTGIALAIAAEEETEEIEEALYANEDLYITGKVPGNGIIDVQPVTVSIDGEEVISAYDIKIYANANQQKKGKTWQPADKKVQVHFRDDRFEGELNVYHIDGSAPEYIDTVEAQDGWVTFEAESFSTYAVTKAIEQTVTIGGSTYKITVSFDHFAGIPEGAELKVTEVSGEEYLTETAAALGWSEDDQIFYTKFLDISIVKDGDEIEPATPVDVKVELLDVEDGAEALEVVHFAEDGHADKVDSTASTDGEVSFTTDSFSVFGFGSILRSLLSWTTDAVNYTLQGFTALLNPTYEAITVTLEEGLEAINAYSVHSTLGSLLNALYVKVSTALNLGSRESIVVYSVKDGEVGDILYEGDNVDESLALGSSDGFAVAKDTGYRRKTFDLGDVTLNGMMPKEAEAEATDVAEAYVDFDAEATLVAAFDIHIDENGTKYQPDVDHPVDVSIATENLTKDSVLQVWHILEDGTREQITDFTVEDGKILFTATGFSVYVVTETKLTRTVEASDGNTYEIEVTYKNTAGIPMEGTELLVSEVKQDDAGYDEYIAASAARMGADAESIALSRIFDIRIVNKNDHSVVYEPVGDVEVSIRLVGEALDDYADLDVLHFVEDGSADGFTVYDVNSSVEGETVQFTTDSFSVYAVVGSVHLRTYRFYTFNEYGEYVEYAFYTDSGKTTFTQTIKNGEKPVAPQNPTNPQDPNATFAGWYEDVRAEGGTEPVFAPNAYDFDNIPEVVRTEEVRLYARFSSFAYLVFHDQYDTETGTFPVAFTVREELTDGSASVDISGYRVNYHGSGNTMVFTGWSEVPITTPGATNNDLDEAVAELDDTITVTGNKELYPIFTPVYWITFYSGYSGSRATYYPEMYCLDGEGPATLNDHIATRSVGSDGAYTFVGWYAGATLEGEPGKEEANITSAIQIADENGALVDDFTDTNDLGVSVQGGKIVLTKNVTLYAAWSTTNSAAYTVVVERQRATDEPDLPDDQKTYEYAESWQLFGPIDEDVARDPGYDVLDTLDGYNALHGGAPISDNSDNPYSNYRINTENSDGSVTILANGSAVLYVKYDWISQPSPSGTFALTFADSLDENQSADLPVVHDVAWATPLADYVPADPVPGRQGYSFSGWYVDKACTTRVIFHAGSSVADLTAAEEKSLRIDENDQDKGHYPFVFVATMPGADVTFYAGWAKEWYIVTIDPNYGAMYGPENGSGTGSTWFWSTYGEKIEEYTTVTRDYVESASGTWYYVNHDRSADYPDRHTYYTQDPSKATEFTTFAYEPGVYRYDGWYEVHEDGSETRYDFNKIVDHTITLKLHWIKVGAFYLVYDPGIGTLNDNEDQETFYAELDENNTYADNADVVVTRVATPPDGYEFVGWRIRGDQSGTIYYPGRSFRLLTQYAATVQGKETVYLDAVYTKVPTASIVYDANGGTITASDLDYGRPFDSTAPAPAYACDVSKGTATISNLVNNSQVYLSDGSGFSRTDATFVGWSNKPVYDPNDTEATLFLPGVQTDEAYHVDTSEPFTLYAVWQVSVKYHLNQSDANFGGNWGNAYSLAGDTYTQNAYIGTAVERPAVKPVYTGSGDLTFRYWATKDENDNYTMYDFTRPVTGALDLYAYWDAPLTVGAHAVDASSETLAEESWTVSPSIDLGASAIVLDPDDPNHQAASYVAAPANYAYGFAAVSDSLGNLKEKPILRLYYSSADGKAHAIYAGGEDAALADGESVYFVYYQQKTLSVSYVAMADNGELTRKTVSSGAPADTGSTLLGQYDMAGSLTTPLGWLNDTAYTYYAFAIGSASAGNAKDLTLITNTSNTDSTRPALLVKNTWRGFQYSTDEGASWTSCGFEPALYVVYFAKQATVVTFTENTVGLAADMGTAFTFDYKIETVSRSDDAVTGTVYNTADSGNSPIQLRGGEAYSAILFTDADTTQKVTITQTAQTGFTTAVSSDGAAAAYPFVYTADGTGTAQNVVFTNTRDTAATVEVHVALVDVANGRITKDDIKRSADASKYSFDLALAGQSAFETVLPSGELFIGDDTYAFGAVLYGTDSGNTVTVGGMSTVSIACEQAEAGDDSVYGIYLKDANGNRLTELGDYTLYYLYYPMPVIRYMEETDEGHLTAISGSLDGSAVSDTITYSHAAITLNGKSVTQNQKLEIPQNGLVISQSVGDACFNMPPLLDRGTDELYLVYSRIGAGAPDQTNVSDISVSDGLTLYLQIRDNKLEWSFDEGAWTAFTQTPTIYAIYQERGYTLEITKTVKTVPIDTGYTDPFTITISSTAINRESYAVEGTGSSTVSAVRASGSTPGTITVQVTDGSVVRIFGLASGTYTVTESGNENHNLTASETYLDEGNSVTSNSSVTDNSTMTIYLDREKTLALTNTAKVICKVGTRYFNTIQSAVQWIEDNSATFSGTIEMLVDYLMPSSDAPVIPYYLDVTLTTAEEYEGTTATITRSGNFASGALFTNSGKLTFGHITLDGNGSNVTAASAMIDNEGTLTVGDGATVQNAKNSGNGGAINTWDGEVTVSGGSVSGNNAASGGAIYATGGDVTVSGGSVSGNSATSGGTIYYAGNTGTVTISGGDVSGNSATNGGAIYLEKGTLKVSGGSMGSNTATENGGAAYALNGAIEISGGTIGGETTANRAANGGAIYLESGSVTVSESAAISHNEASENGGGICTGTGTVTVSGGSLASNAATGNGGGVYTASGAITVSGNSTTINSNSAANGGGLYSGSGTVSVTGAALSSNSATSGNGGGVYADTGSVSLSSATFTGNSAGNGYGGGLYAGSGAATLSSCTFGGADGSGNSAKNGAAIYTDTGSATFSAGTVSFNTATAGGAVGVGSSSARLYFSGDVKVTNNTMNGSASNVYLDQDSDAVINAGVGNNGLGGSASIGVYVPNKDVTVTDINGTTSTENLFDRRGVPGAFFATYTSTSNVGKFSNDRQPGLSVQQETSSKRLYWGKKFTVEVRYLASLSATSFSPVAAGDLKKVDNKNSIDYYAPSGKNAASEIADDLRSAHTISGLNATAVFAVAFVGGDRTFANYITDVNWDSANNRWSFVRRDGTETTGDKLVVYFSEPAYIQIENNTEHLLDISALTVLGQSAINSDTDVGYGYVFAANGVIQNALQPITADDLTLAPGKSVKLLFPGGKNAAWTLSGGFDSASDNIPYTLNGTADTLAADNAGNFSLNGTTLNTNGGTYSIVFGGKSAICRIVTTAIDGVQDSEIAGQTEPDTENGNQVEYTFSTLNQAKNFVVNHMSDTKTATIEMLVDYLIPDSDVVNLPAGYNFTFSTATTGTYKYSDNASDRATISRDQGNNASFIATETGALVSGDYTSKLTVKNLIFDGKEFGGNSIYGGVIKTKGWNVEIDKCDFRNCQARYGGGVFIESVWPKKDDQTPYGYLTVSNSNFTNCKSLEGTDKFGGGGIWTSMREMTVTGCNFNSCEGAATIGNSKNAQGGAVFHFVANISKSIETKSTVTGCTFDNCSANAAGSMECGSKRVTVTGCTFRNSTAKTKNGGALNVWVYDNSSSANASYVYVEGCTFENCYGLATDGSNGNGGAMRSTATYNTIKNCTFIDTRGNDGGAINIFNQNAVDTTVTGCTFSGCGASKRGGAIYCMSKTLTVDGTSTSISNCTAANEGGGIYHGRDANDTSLTVSNATIDNCTSNNNIGGGIYSKAQTVSLTDVTVKNCQKGGGVYLAPAKNFATASATVTNSTIQNNIATGNGGGLYYDCSNGTLTFTSSTVSGNTAGNTNDTSSNSMGGGIYTNAANVTLTGTTVSGNTATGNGGGVCQNYDNANGRLTLDSCTVSGNKSGGKGGGTYTLAQMTIRNDTHVTGNRLTTEEKNDAAGVYLKNGRTLTVGAENSDPNYCDPSYVTGNLTNSGSTPSNLRLSQGSSLTSDNSTNSIDVLCHLSGEFRVIDAFSKGTQFGVSEISSAESPVYTNGFSDISHVFIADDDSLYGIIDRSDTSLRKIIWAGAPICKITDANGRLLYIDTVHEYPAVFDKLDSSNANDLSSVSAFSILRNAQPQLYYADGTLYTGSTYQVKMLVESYTATNRINSIANEGRTIILTTAGSNDSQYPYHGRTGTRSTITRGTTGSVKDNNFITANVNLTLTNIVLDGGSESGVTANDNTRIISSGQSDVSITLGRNSALQNSATTGNGGAVYLNNASLIIEGGAIRNCSAANGGAVYKDGDQGTVTMTGGSITRCTATTNGGGVCIQKGPTATNGSAFTMTGGSITRCTAQNGGGVWVNNTYKMSMTGGSISQNSATSTGGGIAVGGSDARLYFSGVPFVYGNTVSGSANNVYMDQTWSPVTTNNPGTIIHTTGLIRGATIGVYVPGVDNGADAQTSLYDMHGAELDPFGTYEGAPAGFNYFINDRNGLKGGLIEGQTVGTNMKIYWRQIYTLEVNLEVLSRADSDKERDFHFTVTLNGNAGGTSQGTQWNEVNETYGDLEFHAGVATFTLNGSTKTTTMADLLPLGYGYTVTMDSDDATGFTVYPGVTQTGEMNNPSQFLYTVNFRVVRDVVCKITDETYGLLYYKRGEAYAEAVYDALVSAFNRVNMGELYYKVGDSYIPYTKNDHRIEMLIPEYEMTVPTALNTEKTVMLTTADPNADDGFPYAGGSSTAVIKRGYDGVGMITVNGNLTLGNITLDGNGSNYTVSANGDIVNVASGATLTVGTGSTMQNAKTSGSGAAVYLAEGATMNISGAPVFSNNKKTDAVTSGSENGGTTDYYSGTTSKQDIFIAGYDSTDATSLHVTGNINLASGSIAVWVEHQQHYEQSKQFAVMDGGPWNGLDAFRNARTDADTGNRPKDTDTIKYLYGVTRGNDGKVYWYGGADLTITKIVTGDMGDTTKAFTFTITGLPSGESYTYKKYATTDGTTWAEVTSGGGTLTTSANTFTLTHRQKVVIESLPLNTALTIAEVNDNYTTTWQLDSNAATTGSSTSVTLTADATFAVENNLPAVAPTGLSFAYAPFLLIGAAGIMLGLIGRRKRREEE